MLTEHFSPVEVLVALFPALTDIAGRKGSQGRCLLLAAAEGTELASSNETGNEFLLVTPWL